MSNASGDGRDVEFPQNHLSFVDGDAVSEDSEIDFDDEREEDQTLLDVVEAREVGVLLDDPEELSAKGVES
jgi:hypothetical protein